ncbi:MAG: hydrogenase maturation protease [Spirochaetales bacterium]|nr:hydrogenase maturation protease [Spirochaetales bacterium]
MGNPLRRDDGIGPEVIRLLTKDRTKKNSTYKLSSDIDLIDGGTDGLGLIEYLKDYKKVIIIDAVEMKLKPGTIKVFTPEEAVIKINSDALSTHGFGIAELIKLAKGLDINPELIIVGVQPEDISYGEGLSDSIEPVLNKLIKVILNII